ncbi:RNA polymerase sigma factor [Arenimonas soli]|uniref:RNA polymerase sigma factor n=1 Tax=Arenimonas soli TaxID=2269504 RepID=A0ABQ1HQC3_9GAMM|nr:sigma-70 family RNA polymerase sigma factor [Arenimonas soli]GGA84718.1 RNA polymerase sigma factor [Arenimonas soli]
MDDRDAQARIDAALVDSALRDDGARAFEQLVRRHQGLVRAQLRRLLGDDPALADDLAQETFVLAWRKLAQFRGESRFGTWLYRIAYACFLRHLRSHGGRTHQDMALDADDALGTDGPGPEWGLDLDAALRRLSINQRAALLYCVQLEFTHEEAAVVLDMPLGSVKTHVARGKAKLRLLLKDWAPGDQGND